MAKRSLMVVAAMVFIMGLSGSALAATPEGSDTISNELTATITAITDLITLSWEIEPPGTVRLDQTFTTEVSAQLNEGIDTIDRVLYVVNIMRDGNPADPADISVEDDQGQALGYDAGGGFWYYGPPTGFTFNRADTPGGAGLLTTQFSNTIHTAGEYDISIQAVQLAE